MGAGVEPSGSPFLVLELVELGTVTSYLESNANMVLRADPYARDSVLTECKVIRALKISRCSVLTRSETLPSMAVHAHSIRDNSS